MEDVIFLGIIGLVVALALTILSLLWYSGAFLSVEVRSEKPPFANLKLAYKFAVGPFKDCGPLFTELQILAPDLKTCAIYYDDPKKVSSIIIYLTIFVKHLTLSSFMYKLQQYIVLSGTTVV